MSLINLQREGVNFKVNTSQLIVNKFGNSGNETYQANMPGLGTLNLSAEEYEQIIDNNNENEGVE